MKSIDDRTNEEKIEDGRLWWWEEYQRQLAEELQERERKRREGK